MNITVFVPFGALQMVPERIQTVKHRETMQLPDPSWQGCNTNEDRALDKADQGGVEPPQQVDSVCHQTKQATPHP